MSDDSGSESSNDTSADSSSTSESGKEALSGKKTTNSDADTVKRVNAGVKKADSTDWEVQQKSADKKPSGGNEAPSADEVSIPSSVDPDAPANSDNTSSDSSESDD